jgi:hypothetical protein
VSVSKNYTIANRHKKVGVVKAYRYTHVVLYLFCRHDFSFPARKPTLVFTEKKTYFKDGNSTELGME